MSEERSPFPFGEMNLGIVSTNTVDSDGLSNFLSGEEEVVEKQDPPKKDPPKKDPVKEPSSKKEEEDEEQEQKKREEAEKKNQEELKSFLEEETEESKKSNEDPENPEEPKKESEEESNVFTDLSSHLLELGVFTLDEGEEGLAISTPEEFKDRFDYEKKKGASEVLEAYLSRFGEDYADMFDKVFIKGVTPKEYLSSMSVISTVKGLDLADEANQEKVVKEFLRREGRSIDYINKKIERLKSYNDLEDEAKEAQTFLVQKEEEEIQRKAAAKEQEARDKIAAKKYYLQSVQKILQEKIETKEFDGIPVDTKFAQEVGDYITRERYKVGDTELTEFDKEILDLKKPENFALKVKLAMLLKMLKTDPSLSKIQKKAVSQEKNQLFQKLQKSAKQQVVTTPKKEETKSSKSWFS